MAYCEDRFDTNISSDEAIMLAKALWTNKRNKDYPALAGFNPEEDYKVLLNVTLDFALDAVDDLFKVKAFNLSFLHFTESEDGIDYTSEVFRKLSDKQKDPELPHDYAKRIQMYSDKAREVAMN